MKQKSKKKILSWAELRFSIIGRLLATGPEAGSTLSAEFERLAGACYRHPSKDAYVTFGASTIERWYYQALKSEDPVQALGRKSREDLGKTRVWMPALLQALEHQYRNYQHWSYKLHADNLAALAKEKPELGDVPSYTTIRRIMKRKGWVKRKRIKQTAGQAKAAQRLETREVRSYEISYVHGLWHLDFHQGSLRVIDAAGQWHTPIALCILDDHSRLCCHIQWYLNETTPCLLHGLQQALFKRGLPRSLMTDNGAAMVAEETRRGLGKLGIQHEKTLPYSPYQNGKQEAFWVQLEGRFLAMLTRVEALTLDELNRTCQAWVEMEYNRGEHSEIKMSPLTRLMEGRNVSRKAPERDVMDYAFTRADNRLQRRSDGTLSLEGVRFEVPARFRHFQRLSVRYRSWDLSSAYLADPQTDDLLSVIYPQDKEKNSDGSRRFVSPCAALPEPLQAPDDADPYPPMLRELMRNYAATGLLPAYLPYNRDQQESDHEK
ncbi:MAG: DDE-type integrase/transposase/recombinase [Acidobacteriota bacterium]|nr:DDE-type integrase/transposase/recombinase [Acidobacteriota bacterium]